MARARSTTTDQSAAAPADRSTTIATGLAAASAAATPGGQIRIVKGSQQRCIWPVHLSGWQQLGWALPNGNTPAKSQPAEAEVVAPQPREAPLVVETHLDDGLL